MPIRVLVRLGLLGVQGGRVIENQKVPERAEVLSEENQHLFNAETLAKCPDPHPSPVFRVEMTDDSLLRRIRTQSDAANQTHKEHTDEDVLLLRQLDDPYFTRMNVSPVRLRVCGERRGPHGTLRQPQEKGEEKPRKRRETLLRRNQTHHQPSQQSALRHGPQALAEEPANQRLALLGELLYILRPLIYRAFPSYLPSIHVDLIIPFVMAVLAMYIWGIRSWRAWAASLAVDVGSYAASSSAYQGTRQHPEIGRRTVQVSSPEPAQPTAPFPPLLPYASPPPSACFIVSCSMGVSGACARDAPVGVLSGTQPVLRGALGQLRAAAHRGPPQEAPAHIIGPRCVLMLPLLHS